MEIGEFGVDRPDVGGRRPRGEALGHKKKRVAGVGGEARAEQGDGRDRGAPGVRGQGARRRAPGSRVSWEVTRFRSRLGGGAYTQASRAATGADPWVLRRRSEHHDDLLSCR